MIIRKSTAEIETMASAGRIVADTIALLGEHIRPGVSTGELDELADDYIRSQGGVSSFMRATRPERVATATGSGGARRRRRSSRRAATGTRTASTTGRSPTRPTW